MHENKVDILVGLVCNSFNLACMGTNLFLKKECLVTQFSFNCAIVAMQEVRRVISQLTAQGFYSAARYLVEVISQGVTERSGKVVTTYSFSLIQGPLYLEKLFKHFLPPTLALEN